MNRPFEGENLPYFCFDEATSRRLGILASIDVADRVLICTIQKRNIAAEEKDKSIAMHNVRVMCIEKKHSLTPHPFKPNRMIETAGFALFLKTEVNLGIKDVFPCPFFHLPLSISASDYQFAKKNLRDWANVSFSLKPE